LWLWGGGYGLFRRDAPEERCDLCGVGLAGQHDHLFEVANRKLVCACQACAILCRGGVGQPYKRVPRRVRALSDFCLADSQWESLRIPINMAFAFRSSNSGSVIAIYPSPAGPTESRLPDEYWDEIVAANPVLASMETDVEALLVNRLGPIHGFSEQQYFLLSIGECFKLVGLVRANWQGLSGGEKMWQTLRDQFADFKPAGVDEVAGQCFQIAIFCVNS